MKIIHKFFNKNGDFKKGGLWRKWMERREDLRESYHVKSRLRRAGFLAMRSTLISVLVGGGFLLVASCASVPTGPLAEGEVRLLSLEVPGTNIFRIRAPSMVNITFQADGGPEIKRVCFFWSGDGPYCANVTDIDYGPPGKIRVQPRVPGAMAGGSHALECYVQYIYKGKTMMSNVVNTTIVLRF
jgi:hypothetical protein